MQHILMLLWHLALEQAGNHMPELTLADYDRLGGIGEPGTPGGTGSPNGR